MEQLSLFNLPMASFIDRLQQLLDKVISEQELPKSSLHLYSNLSAKGENSGKEISKSICIYEPEYPSVREEKNNPGRNFVVMNVKQHSSTVELLIRNSQFDTLSTPNSATIKNVKSDLNFVHVSFSETDDNLFSYIEENILLSLKNYRSKARTFGCCSRFVQCSDAKRCLHPNKLYSTACTYRHHLESGRIFYGNNKNI